MAFKDDDWRYKPFAHNLDEICVCSSQSKKTDEEKSSLWNGLKELGKAIWKLLEDMGAAEPKVDDDRLKAHMKKLEEEENRATRRMIEDLDALRSSMMVDLIEQYKKIQEMSEAHMKMLELEKALRKQTEEEKKALKKSTEEEESALAMGQERQCLEHRKFLNSVCTDHKEAICNECLIVYHNKCPILDMKLALASYEKLRQSIKSELEKGLKHMDNVNCDLNQELSTRNKVINSVGGNLNKAYDAAAKLYMQTIKQNEDNLLSALKELEERKMNLEKILDNVNGIELNVSSIDNLLSMYKLKKLAEENIENFQKMCKKESLSKVNQNVDLVAIDISKRLIEFALDPIRDSIYLDISVAQLKSFSVKPYRNTNFIRGCTIRANDEMCFVDAKNDRLVIAKADGEQSSIPLPGRPFDVKRGDQNLIVTLRQNRSICFVVPDPIVHSTVSAEQVKFSARNTGSIGGISRADDHVVVAVECFGFYILDFKGEIKNKIKIIDDINIQYVASAHSKIFYTKSDENRVYCCDYAGTTLWVFEDAKRMKTPTGITVDEDGCVYVSCLNSYNVFVISPDGQFGKELISSINRIHAIDYDVFGKTLLICSENGDARSYKLQKVTRYC